MSATQSLLDALAKHLNTEPIQPGRSGQCTVSFDDTLFVTFLVEDAEHLSALSYVLDLDDTPPQVLQRCMSYNLASPALGGARVAADLDSNSLVLIRHWLAAQISAEVFIASVETFVDLVAAMRADTAEVLAELSAGRLIDSASPSFLAHLVNMA